MQLPSFRSRCSLAHALSFGVASIVLVTSGLASAEAWPSKPIRLVVPAAPGGSADPLARAVAEELSKRLQQPVVVENRPGANGNIGAASVAKSNPDGYTLLLGWPGTLVSAVTLYGAKPFHPLKDFEPIVIVGSIPNIVLVKPSLPINTLEELTEYARKNPGALNFGSTGSGSSYHLSGELYKKVAGVSMVHVPYASPGAVFTDFLGGRLELAFPGVAVAAPYVRDGRLRALAVMSDKRSEALPNIPSTTELGFPQLTSETWLGLLAPKGTPTEITMRINEVINTALKNGALREKLTVMGYTIAGGTTLQFTTTIKEDIIKWGEVVKFSGAKID